MGGRQKFPDRRSSFQVHLHHEGQDYHVGFTFFGFGAIDPGDVGEIFISSKKASSTYEVLARDAAILASHALQRGATVEGLVMSLTRGDCKGRRRAQEPVHLPEKRRRR